MNVLVTGSAGFIGSHVVKALAGRGDTVYGLDKKNGPDEDLAFGSGAERLLSRLPINSIEAIIHLASTCSTPASVRGPSGTFRDVVVTAANILESARVYAPKATIVMTTSVKARDGKTPYGAAKRMVELWTKEYRSAYGMRTIINRPGTIYGPGQEGSEDSGWIAWFCKAQIERLPVVINGDGSQVRDLLHVDDYVRLLLDQIDHPEPYVGGTFDVGGGEINAVSVLYMAKTLGLSYTFGPDRYGDEMEYIGLNNTPGDWKPEIHWRDGVFFWR